MHNSKIIIALDFKNRQYTLDFLELFGEEKLFVKIGMELFYKEGTEFVKEIQRMGHNIFLDLKIYDIPNTAKQALYSISELNVDFVTIHLMGGNKMIEQCMEVADDKNVNLLGVTVLTSQSKEDLIKTVYTIDTVVTDLAQRASTNNMYGIICAASDIPFISKHVSKDLKYITPGIRMKNDEVNDQKRVVTPKDAIANGSDYIVVGRSITQSLNPYETYKKIQREIGEK